MNGEIKLSYRVGDAWKVLSCDMSQKPAIGKPGKLEVIANVNTTISPIEQSNAASAIMDYHKRTYEFAGLTIHFPQ